MPVIKPSVLLGEAHCVPRSTKLIKNTLVKEIYEALENNSDLTLTWKKAKHTTFKKIFGPLR